MLANPEANVWENSGKFQGDIVLDDWQVEALVTNFAAGRAAYIWPNTKWPGNVVVYDFGQNEFDAAQQRAILDAIGWIEHFSCVRFRRRTPFDRNYVLLTGRPDGCYASVGYWGDRGIHTLNLARSSPGTGCLWVTVIIHEWLHVLGFFHMQSTYNRDNYVRINFNNIVNGMGHNFDRYENNIVNNLGLPYEYTSCMHYSSHAFSTNGQPTITPLRSFPGIMGQQDHVTTLDWLRLRRHYNCPGAWSQDEVELLEKEVQLYTPLYEKAPPVNDGDGKNLFEAEETSYKAEDTFYEAKENQQSDDFSPIVAVEAEEPTYKVEELQQSDDFSPVVVVEVEEPTYEVEENKQSDDVSPTIVVAEEPTYEFEENKQSDDVSPTIVVAEEPTYEVEENKQSDDFSPIVVVVDAEEPTYEVEKNQQLDDFSPIFVVEAEEPTYEAEKNKKSDDFSPIVVVEAEEPTYEIEENQQRVDFSPLTDLDAEEPY
ncbi:unnamed protein product [Euphydryas editha]|nr:unnamed protein product [Euphydryas editha]